ncbi:unnamed protein product [Phytophthora fragariaefolia]|uniref:Unnamed protein product n=1 Tax=Phytophthora fragariaefolia TaxID=1490495 RepID=A0A9W6Y930_9STRA|nr:unnamed protein product [Phytophthora fragariaefolia]
MWRFDRQMTISREAIRLIRITDEHDRHVAAADDSERRSEPIGTYSMSENSGRRGDFPNRGLDRLAPIGLPQLASPPVDADCVYAFVAESKWLKTQRREEANEVKTMEIEKERNGSFGGGEIDERKYHEWNDDRSEGLVLSIARKTWHEYEPKDAIKLLSGERLGWRSAQKFDKQVRMRTVVQGTVKDAHTRILLDTGANVSVISELFAKQLRLREIRDHGRCMEIQGFIKGTMATTKRALAKVTLRWNRVYEYELWVMDHGAGVDVALGAYFMIPAGVRLDFFHATTRLPDDVEIPLIKTQRMADTREEDPHVPDGHTEDEGEIYQRWLTAQPSAEESESYTTPTKILRRPSESSEGSEFDGDGRTDCATATTEPPTEMESVVAHQEVLHPKPTECSDWCPRARNRLN